MIIPKKIVNNYVGMLNDRARNAWYKKHISSVACDRTVLDVGAGTGILSAYALESGAKFVHSIEKSPEAYMVGKHLLRTIGYENNNWICDDYKNVNLSTVDFVIADQVGPGLFDQEQINLWKFYNNLCGHNYISIPDTVAIDLYVFQGNISSIGSHYIFDYNELPTSFYSALEQLSIRPIEIIENFIAINKTSVETSLLERTIDLTKYSDVTLVFVNKIGFQNDFLVLTQSETQNWKHAPKLYISDCRIPVRVFWNSQLSNVQAPDDHMYKGYWDYHLI